MRHVPLLLAGWLVIPATLAAQQQPAGQPPACSGPEFRAFDYWLGEWTVTGAENAAAGSNVITSISGGCALLEQWTDARGSTGTSINYYDPRTDRWNQLWVGAGGSILELEGGLVAGVMELRGERPGPDGTTVIDRIRWIPADGQVRQHWETSSDDGRTWTTAFDGTYTKQAGGMDPEPDTDPPPERPAR